MYKSRTVTSVRQTVSSPYIRISNKLPCVCNHLCTTHIGGIRRITAWILQIGITSDSSAGTGTSTVITIWILLGCSCLLCPYNLLVFINCLLVISCLRLRICKLLRIILFFLLKPGNQNIQIILLLIIFILQSKKIFHLHRKLLCPIFHLLYCSLIRIHQISV